VEEFWGETITFVRRGELTPLLMEGDKKEKFVVVSFNLEQRRKENNKLAYWQQERD